ncbi:MAG: hypothetical protein LC104_22125 [Bacteroidales bacterium]|nr:hypothetical protein [Bacteroidales bacterium]
MNIEIVSHCWRYPRLLNYQLSSLVRFPPVAVHVRVTIYHTEDDAGVVRVLDYFGRQSVPGVVWDWRALPREQLCRRAIGRNQAALASNADWVWFTDADYCFGPGCLDTLAYIPDASLVFPREVQTHASRELGDQAILAASGPPRILELDPSQYVPKRISRAIGGLQIAGGAVCRERGYCAQFPRLLRPSLLWARTHEDIWFRRSLQSHGVPIDLPHLYRIRHSTRGQDDPTVEL